jgi:hypothetical protein
MFLNAHIKVTITNQTTGQVQVLQDVHQVNTKNDSKEIGSTCDIIVPLACRISYANSPGTFVTQLAQTLFSSGDAVTVTASYDDYPEITVFQGFVYEFIEGTPITIKCLDNIFLLNQSTIDLFYKSVSLQALITRVLQGTGITLMLPTLGLNLVNITFRLMSPASILEWLKKELGLNISLQGNQLYCNIASNTLATVNLDTGINVIKSDLQKPEAVYLKLRVKAWFINSNGTKSSLEVGDTGGELREVFFYKIQPATTAEYEKLAGEALKKYQQFKYSGNVETLLYPDIQLFDQVAYTDRRYPDRTGNYVCVGMNHELTLKGFHRRVRMSYLSDLISTAQPSNN